MDEQRKPIEMPSADVADYSPEINALYDAQKAQQEQSLKTAYDQNVQTLQNSKQAIAPLYNQQANDLSTQFERTRRMNNMKADYNGLNTGAASQMDLAQQSNYLNSFGKLRTAQAQAEQAVDQKLADLEISYKNSVSQALADNDYQRAAALMKEYQRRDEATKEEQRYQYNIKTAAQQYADQYARQQEQDAFAREQYQNSLAAQSWEQQYKERAYNDALAQQQSEEALNAAKIRAAYGDFSGYEALYGADTANAMREFWIQANPDYAYANGLMDANKYYQLTGRYPAGYSTGSSGGTGGYSRSGGGGGNDIDAAISQLVIQGVPYAQAIEALNSDSTMSMSEYKKTKAAIDAAYKSTWAGGSNAGMYNAANNSAEQRGTNEWKKPKSVTPTTNSKYSGG